jgi:hypothetical protein
MSDEELTTMIVNYQGIEAVEIISYMELPKERQQIQIELFDEPEKLREEVIELIELCLIDPQRVHEFVDLDLQNLLWFYVKWIRSSMMIHRDGVDGGVI